MIDYSSLNTEQLEAVQTTEGYVRVIASAGSGKTRALTYRYAFIVDELGISTEDIACITFTNKAAGEMKKRIRNMIGDKDIGYVCTFHGLGNKVLKEDIHHIKWPKNFRILDDEDTEAILKRVYATFGITKEDMSFRDAKDEISLIKITRRDYYVPLLYQESIESIKPSKSEDDSLFNKIFLGYLSEQKKEYCLDFNDLIQIPLFIFQLYDEVRLKWAKRFHYLMVDEFQDVSDQNYQMCEAISSFHKNLFVVGDPDQIIYTWRGAKTEFILNFDQVHPGTKTIMMNKNYRSNEGIIIAANSLIAKNDDRIPKEMTAIRKSTVLSNYFHAKTEFEEAEFVFNTIETLVSLGVQHSDIAILYRAHYATRVFEQVFITHKLPYVITSGVPFYQRKEIKDIIAYLRFIQADNALDFERIIKVPKRGIGDKRIGELKILAKTYEVSLYDALKLGADLIPKMQNTKASEFIKVIENARAVKDSMAVSDLIDLIYTTSGMEDELRTIGDDDRLENVASLKADIQELEDTSGDNVALEDYLDTISLFTSADETIRKNAVKLMTIHAAKGLEFPYVFIVCVNEGILPSSKARTKAALEEERRLAYVAFTRAKEELFISESEGYHFVVGYRYPSRFIFNTSLQNVKMLSELNIELADDACDYIITSEMVLAKETFKLRQDETALKLQIGVKVVHDHFGEGLVVESPIDDYILVDFSGTESPRKVSMTTLKVIDEC